MALPANKSADYSFPKNIRLRQRADYLRLTQTGSKFAAKFVILLIGKDSSDEPRLGITVSRKVGCAAVRNRIKRYLREFFRQHRAMWPKADFVIIARANAAKVTFDEIMQDLITMLQRVSRK